MYKSRLLKSLKSLTPKELNKFTAFVASPYFNTNPKVTAFLEYIVEYRDDWENPKLKFEKVSQHFFAGNKHKDQRLRDYMSTLFGLFKQFLSQLSLEEKNHFSQLELLGQLRKRDLEKIYLSNYQQAVKQAEESIYLNEAYYLEQYQLGQEVESFYGNKDLRQIEDGLQEMVDHLDVYYISQKLKHHCEMLNRTRIVNREYQLNLAQEIEGVLSQQDYSHLQVPIVLLNYQVYLTLTHPKEEHHFYKLLTLLEKYVGQIPVLDMRNFYNYAQNYCIRKINKGEAKFVDEIFNIYKRLLEGKLLMADGYLPHPHYKNIVTVGLRLKATDWVQDFIENYKTQLSPDIQENAYHYNLASFYYETEKYDETIQLLNRVEFTDLYYEMGAKYILLKAYYELQEFNLLSYMIISFDRYIKRHKSIPSQRRTAEINFLGMLKRIAKVKEQKPYKTKEYVFKQKQKLEKVLRNKNPIVNINYLKEKMAEL